jgi:hypothetical protein
MSTRRITSINTTALYLIMTVIVVLAFLFLGGMAWIRGMMHGSSSMGMSGLHWGQILISLGIGFALGLLVSKRKW